MVGLFWRGTRIECDGKYVQCIDALQVLPDGVMSCTIEATAQIVAQRTITASNFSTPAGIEGEFVSALADGVQQVGSCYEQNILDNTLDMMKDVFSWGSGLGTFLDASGAISDLGQAAQRTIELETVASAVETAIIQIKPGSASRTTRFPRSLRSRRRPLRLAARPTITIKVVRSCRAPLSWPTTPPARIPTWTVVRSHSVSHLQTLRRQGPFRSGAKSNPRRRHVHGNFHSGFGEWLQSATASHKSHSLRSGGVGISPITLSILGHNTSCRTPL